MEEIRQTALPGVGALFDFACEGRRRIGVITRPSGRRELVIYQRDDPDAVEVSLDLSPEESSALAELLGGSRLTLALQAATQQIEGLAIDWLTLPRTFAARSIRELEIRNRTGATVVAVIRDDEQIPAPGPEEVLRANDVVVVSGTRDGIRQAEALLDIGT